MLTWKWKNFAELTPDELYLALELRQQVFVVEQRSIYLDADGYDRSAYHLLGMEDQPEAPWLAAYLRVLPPKTKYPQASLGRVVVAPEARSHGHGRVLVQKGIDFIEARYPRVPIRIGAQNHLRAFYEDFGFRVMSDVYDEDGIPHVDMVR
ncbi:ElaA protein [Cystobacter fuscus DSM 2262]|uniref:ElaA protein n=1 Tax=Cystobacter fuscus (strain ATCC 25194 / DSM 2262 / NBRC 100088 / M29) TaxID=1242864 RepID=S9PBP5_CYSF2|nr:GNAT family N-acetyltransferase [Cystobacter fuscus]EPX60526.1 ElaA protein [Cystobacter fuscus DSM 2262]